MNFDFHPPRGFNFHRAVPAQQAQGERFLTPSDPLPDVGDWDEFAEEGGSNATDDGKPPKEDKDALAKYESMRADPDPAIRALASAARWAASGPVGANGTNATNGTGGAEATADSAPNT